MEDWYDWEGLQSTFYYLCFHSHLFIHSFIHFTACIRATYHKLQCASGRCFPSREFLFTSFVFLSFVWLFSCFRRRTMIISPTSYIFLCSCPFSCLTFHALNFLNAMPYTGPWGIVLHIKGFAFCLFTTSPISSFTHFSFFYLFIYFFLSWPYWPLFAVVRVIVLPFLSLTFSVLVSVSLTSSFSRWFAFPGLLFRHLCMFFFFFLLFLSYCPISKITVRISKLRLLFISLFTPQFSDRPTRKKKQTNKNQQALCISSWIFSLCALLVL